MQAVQDNDITRQVKYIVAELEGRNNEWKHDHINADEVSEDGEEFLDIGAYEYLNDVLDIEYVVSGSKEYLGARVLVAFGGPNIWINTRTNEVQGYWGGEQCIRHFDDVLGIDDVLREFWECSQ